MKHKGENGEIVVEASIVVTIAVIFISVFIYIGMILYQQSLVSIMANQTASNIAQVYSNSIKDPFTGYVDSDSVYQSVTYSNIKTDAYVDVLKQKANTLAYYRLKSTRILTTGESNVDVEIVKKPNELLKSQIVVTIHDQYELPLVSFFGTNNKLKFSATGRADCVDILEYINGIEAIGDPENSNVTNLPDTDTCLVQFFDNKTDKNLIVAFPVLKGKSIITSNAYTHSTMPADPANNGLEFTGWAKSDGTPFSATTEIEEDTFVYGLWRCMITFDPDGGTVSPESKKVSVGSVTAFPTPERGEWTFSGWFTEKDGEGDKYTENTTVVESNVTLYAYWTCEHKHMITAERKIYNCRDVGGRPESYELRRCSVCGGNEQKITLENKHFISPNNLVIEDEFISKSDEADDFMAQCDCDHLSGARVGLDGSYSSGYANRTYYHSFHITCEFCGKSQPKVYFYNIDGSGRYDYIYYHSNNVNRVHTACEYPDLKF